MITVIGHLRRSEERRRRQLFFSTNAGALFLEVEFDTYAGEVDSLFVSGLKGIDVDGLI